MRNRINCHRFVSAAFLCIAFLCSCHGASGADQVSLSAPESSFEIQQSDDLLPAQQEKPESKTSSEMGSTEKPQTEALPVILRDKTPEDIYSELQGDAYVLYYEEGYKPAENLYLLDEWVDAYQEGYPATLWVHQRRPGSEIGDLWMLECHGADTYCIYAYSSEGWLPHTSALVIRRHSDYVWGGDQSPKEWFEFWQYRTTPRIPVETTSIEDFAAGSPYALGEITPEQATEIALLRDSQFYSYIKQNFYGNFAANGQYFPLDYKSENTQSDYRGFLLEAVQINGRPFYVIGLGGEAADGYGYIYAVDGEKGEIVYQISNEGNRYTMLADGGQTFITAVNNEP